jgi:galactokinase
MAGEPPAVMSGGPQGIGEAFRQKYGPAEGLRVFRAPGRVNLIGEHTDYTLGFVMPMALDLATYIGAAPSSDGQLRLYSEIHDEMREFEAATIIHAAREGHWTDYPIGVARELARDGLKIEGANLFVRSTVPEGSGLSSSAALEVSSALALLDGREIPPLELARLCQRAEVDFVKMPCGIMDQYVSVFGREHAAVEIDCRSLEHRYVPLPEGVAFLAVNTMVKHALGASAYRERVKECATAVAEIRKRFPKVESLRDVTLAIFESVEASLPPVVAKRARHVVNENHRVNRFVEASAQGQLGQMGRLLVESHRSLQHDYEVSCAELDFLVDTALAIQGVYGSRMTGGGFGGCTVTMLEAGAVAHFREQITSAYEHRFRITPQIYDCKPSAGAGEVT